MRMQEEFNKMVEKLKMEQDEIKLKMHLASMETKQEYEEAEKKMGTLESQGLRYSR